MALPSITFICKNSWINFIQITNINAKNLNLEKYAIILRTAHKISNIYYIQAEVFYQPYAQQFTIKTGEDPAQLYSFLIILFIPISFRTREMMMAVAAMCECIVSY